MDRRDFLRVGAAATLTLGTPLAWRGAADPGDGSLPKRPLGRTGERLTIFGFGGTAVMSLEQAAANSLVAEAFERGVNYYDVSPTYGDAEQRLGPALQPFRQRCFLASKTDYRDRPGAERDLDSSLRTLRTDHFDLYQHHAVDKLEDWQRIVGPGGAQEAFAAARQAGKIRFLGICTHSVEVAQAAIEHGSLDTIMFPVNYVLATRSAFGPQVLEQARRKRMGIIAIKGMARGKYSATLPADRRTPKCWYEPCALPEEAALAYRWSLSQPVTASIPPGNPAWFRLALEIAGRFRPISRPETTRLLSYLEGSEPLFP